MYANNLHHRDTETQRLHREILFILIILLILSKSIFLYLLA